jgi:serine/threonine protein kinase
VWGGGGGGGGRKIKKLLIIYYLLYNLEKMGKRKMSKRRRCAKNKKDKSRMKCIRANLKQRIVTFITSREITQYSDIREAFCDFRLKYGLSEPLVRNMGLQSFCDPLKHLFVIKHNTEQIFIRKTINERIVEFVMDKKRNSVHNYNDITSVYQQFRDAHRNEISVRQLSIATFCIALEPFFIFDHDTQTLQSRISTDGMELISSGGDGVIFRYTTVHGQDVGLKIFFEHKTYVRELEVSSSIGLHPNIRSVQADENFNNTNAVFFKFCKGNAHFKTWCDEKDVDIVTFIQQVSNAMRFIHEQGFAHNDLKPGNVMYHNGCFFICDFGRVFRKNRRTSLQRLERQGHFRGTKHYAAPELNYNTIMPSESTDVYSLGKTVESICKSIIKSKALSVGELQLIRRDAIRWCNIAPATRPSFNDIFQKYSRYKNISELLTKTRFVPHKYKFKG